METLKLNETLLINVNIEDNLIFNMVTDYVFYTYTEKYMMEYRKAMRVLAILHFLNINHQYEYETGLNNYVRFYYNQILLGAY